MGVNWKEINLLIQELDLDGASIQNIRQSNNDLIILECYKKGQVKKVALNLNYLYSSIYHLSTINPPLTVSKRFTLLLRKYMKGSKIVSVVQPGNNRLVMFHVKHYQDDYYLIVKLWGPHGNIYFANQYFKMLDSLYPHHVNPPLIIFPIKRADKTLKIVDYSKFKNLNSYINDNVKQHQEKELINRINSDYAKLKHRIVTKKNDELKKIEFNKGYQKNQEIAFLIQSQKKKIVRGLESISCIDYFNDHCPIKIELNKKFDAKENADYYYKKYNKQKKTFLLAEDALIQLDKELLYLEESYLDHLQKGDFLLTDNSSFRTTITKKNNQIGLRLTFNKHIFLIGRNAQENDDLLRYHAKGLDWWFHVRGYSGGYIIVKNRDRKVLPIEVILAACALAIHYSQAKKHQEGSIHYIQIKYIKRIKNGPKGAVSVMKDNNINYKVESHRIEYLLKLLKQG